MTPRFLSDRSELISKRVLAESPSVVTGYLDSITNYVNQEVNSPEPDLFLNGQANRDAFIDFRNRPDINNSGYVARFRDPSGGKDAVGSITPRSSRPLPISDSSGKLGSIDLSTNSVLVDLSLTGGNNFLPVVLGSTAFGEATNSQILNQTQVDAVNAIPGSISANPSGGFLPLDPMNNDQGTQNRPFIGPPMVKVYGPPMPDNLKPSSQVYTPKKDINPKTGRPTSSTIDETLTSSGTNSRTGSVNSTLNRLSSIGYEAFRTI